MYRIPYNKEKVNTFRKKFLSFFQFFFPPILSGCRRSCNGGGRSEERRVGKECGSSGDLPGSTICAGSLVSGSGQIAEGSASPGRNSRRGLHKTKAARNKRKTFLLIRFTDYTTIINKHPLLVLVNYHKPIATRNKKTISNRPIPAMARNRKENNQPLLYLIYHIQAYLWLRSTASRCHSTNTTTHI